MEIEVEDPWFSYLVSGVKSVEGRKKSPKWVGLKAGQEVMLRCKQTGERRRCIITYIHEYENLPEYLVNEGVGRCLPGVNNLKDAVDIYRQWSTDEELSQYKFLGIGIKVPD